MRWYLVSSMSRSWTDAGYDDELAEATSRAVEAIVERHQDHCWTVEPSSHNVFSPYCSMPQIFNVSNSSFSTTPSQLPLCRPSLDCEISLLSTSVYVLSTSCDKSSHSSATSPISPTALDAHQQFPARHFLYPSPPFDISRSRKCPSLCSTKYPDS